jgi:hypothetical protein
MDSSRSRFEEFRNVVLDDESVQGELRGLDNEREFISRVVELGRARGFDFNESDVEDELSRARRTWLEAGI